MVDKGWVDENWVREHLSILKKTTAAPERVRRLKKPLDYAMDYHLASYAQEKCNDVQTGWRPTPAITQEDSPEATPGRQCD